MKSFCLAFVFALCAHLLAAQPDTVRFQLCAELWKDSRPIKGTTLVFGASHPDVLYPPLVFSLATDQHCADLSILPGNYLPGTTFAYSTMFSDMDHLNGIDFLDLCLIAKHILGLEPLPPYGLVAADLNSSGSVTTMDIVEARKLIMGIYQQLPNGSVWRFSPDYCILANPNNPFGFPCGTNIDMNELIALDGDTARIIGLKTGDVNGDVVLPGEIPMPPSFSDSVTMRLPQGVVLANSPVLVPVKFEEDITLQGLQVQFLLDPALLAFDTVLSGTLAINFGNVLMDPNTGKLKIMALMADALFVPAGEPLFYLRLKALQTVALEDAMSLLNEPNYYNHLFGSGCALSAIEAKLSGAVSSKDLGSPSQRVSPPSPNPFGQQTYLDIELERAETALLEVLDLTGRILVSEEKNLSAGHQRWEIPTSGVAPGSLVIWRLRVAGQWATGKLVRQ